MTHKMIPWTCALYFCCWNIVNKKWWAITSYSNIATLGHIWCKKTSYFYRRGWEDPPIETLSRDSSLTAQFLSAVDEILMFRLKETAESVQVYNGKMWTYMRTSTHSFPFLWVCKLYQLCCRYIHMDQRQGRSQDFRNIQVMSHPIHLLFIQLTVHL